MPRGIAPARYIRGSMTYCVGVALDQGIIFGSDSRTNAGVDNFATFCKTTVFERRDDRVIVLLSSGNLAGTQAVVNRIRQVADNLSAETTIWTANTMFDVAMHVSDVVRDVERRDGSYLERGGGFNASFIIGGQIKGESMRLFRTFREGNFIEATRDTPFFQTGEAKYGKPILDRVIHPSTDMMDAAKCVLVSFDATMRSNLSVGMPIDLACYQKDSLVLSMRKRFTHDDPYFSSLTSSWEKGVKELFRQMPQPSWDDLH
jgi:putative proteasome-type protease